MAQLLFRKETILADAFREYIGCPPMNAEEGEGEDDDEIVPEEEVEGDEEDDTGSVFNESGSVVPEDERDDEREEVSMV
uniref:Uncharacterized protein n=1 Tax=Globodera rostochiensis TaxID=31243 RepID=A0A914HE26_GLORO